VAVSLVASIVVVVIGLNARLDSGTTAGVEKSQIVVKAGKAKTFTDNSNATIR
jgi:hypothetical protein